MQTCVSMNLLCNFIEITLRHGCSSVHLLHIVRTALYKDTSGRFLLVKAFIFLQFLVKLQAAEL